MEFTRRGTILILLWKIDSYKTRTGIKTLIKSIIKTGCNI